MILFKDEVRIVVYSSLFAESRNFYENTLGLPVVKDWDHGQGALGVVYLLGNTLLEILQGVDIEPKNNFYIYSKVEDVDRLWQELSVKLGAIQEPQTQPWGHRNFLIKDPNGYAIKFFSEV